MPSTRPLSSSTLHTPPPPPTPPLPQHHPPRGVAGATSLNTQAPCEARLGAKPIAALQRACVECVAQMRQSGCIMRAFPLLSHCQGHWQTVCKRLVHFSHAVLGRRCLCQLLGGLLLGRLAICP